MVLETKLTFFFSFFFLFKLIFSFSFSFFLFFLFAFQREFSVFLSVEEYQVPDVRHGLFEQYLQLYLDSREKKDSDVDEKVMTNSCLSVYWRKLLTNVQRNQRILDNYHDYRALLVESLFSEVKRHFRAWATLGFFKSTEPVSSTLLPMYLYLSVCFFIAWFAKD